MKMLRIVAGLCAGLALAGCGVGISGPDASPEAVARAAYVHDGPPAITLYTMISNSNGTGAHTSMMINASQRVIFDPAGDVRIATVPEIGDVLYGITPQVHQLFETAHARETYHVRVQRIEVPAAVAERALQLAQSNGPVGSAACTTATSRILSQLPGFGGIRQTLFPLNLSEQFGRLPGVTTRHIREDDPDDKQLAIDAFESQLAAR